MRMYRYIVNKLDDFEYLTRSYLYLRLSLIKYRKLFNLSLFDILYIMIKTISSLEESPINWYFERLVKVDDYRIYLYLTMTINFSIDINDFYKKYSKLALVNDKYHNTDYYNQILLVYKANKSKINEYLMNKNKFTN